jgi:hypothetical protein
MYSVLQAGVARWPTHLVPAALPYAGVEFPMLQRDSKAELPDPLGCPVRMLRAMIVAIELSQLCTGWTFMSSMKLCYTHVPHLCRKSSLGGQAASNGSKHCKVLNRGLNVQSAYLSEDGCRNCTPFRRYLQIESFQEHTPISGPGKTPWPDGRLQLKQTTANVERAIACES